MQFSSNLVLAERVIAFWNAIIAALPPVFFVYFESFVK